MIRRPPSIPGLKVGLLGGSFNPPHEGHLLISKIALRRLGLDRVWWLFSPGNPLKDNAPADMAMRSAEARKLVSDPRIILTDIESALNTRYTADTLRALTSRYTGTHFVWLMGEDNLAQFHQWEDWRGIAEMVPIAVFSRPGSGFPALNAPAAKALERYRLPASKAQLLYQSKPPVWSLLVHPQSSQSSTKLRAERNWS